MKILIGNKFFFLKGGAETVFFQERDHLLKNGYDVVDFSMDHPQNIDSPFSKYFVPYVEYRGNSEIQGFNKLKSYISIASSFIHNSKALQNIKNLIEIEKPDIAHLHNIYHQITPSILSVLHDAGVKIALTLHDYKLICPNYLMQTKGKICQRCKNGNYWQAFFNRCEQGSFSGSFLLSLEAYWHKYFKSYENVDLFITPSLFMADIVSKSRIDKEKIRVLHNGIDIDQFSITHDDDGYALYFGRISREKGIETFLKGHSLLAPTIPAKVVGTGPLLDGLKAQYKNVEFLGYKQGQELMNIIRKAAFIVVPSEWYENCSMVVLESMALGKPVVASKTGGIPEQVEDGKTGFLFEMGNQKELAQKMEILAQDNVLRSNMGRSARTKLEKEYSLNQHYKGLINIYDEMVSNRE